MKGNLWGLALPLLYSSWGTLRADPGAADHHLGQTASRGDLVFSADCLIRLVEEGLNQLPYKECIVPGQKKKFMVTTPTGYKYEGVKFEKGNCGVSIMRHSTGNTVIEAVKFLLGVQPSVILLSLFSTPHGAQSSFKFPGTTVLTTEVHPVAPVHFGQNKLLKKNCLALC
ncbi:uracil phosphoribosyltransferase homolog [Molossus molossus]|uniref:uracil phosphoribosyltransferase homolog n=1 Tax=Molossus molossus TaxID=27622 RepID=UPI0017471449|nr:uracil phosphoribosyltransferase homolog [Molossus molossus]